MSADFNSNSDSNDSQQSSKYPPERLRGLIRFEKGNNANPGGRPKGTPRIDVIYARLLAMTPDEIQNFQPKNGAEILAFKQFKEGCINKKSLSYAQEISNRTIGPVEKKIKVINETELEKERMLFNSAVEAIQNKTGCTRDEAVIAIVSINASYARFIESE